MKRNKSIVMLAIATAMLVAECAACKPDQPQPEEYLPPAKIISFTDTASEAATLTELVTIDTTTATTTASKPEPTTAQTTAEKRIETTAKSTAKAGSKR